MKKSVILTYIFVTVILSLTGCLSYRDDGVGGETDPIASKGPLVIAGIYKDGSRALFIDEGISASDTTYAYHDSEYLFIDVSNDEDTYKEAIDNVIADKVDGVIISQPFSVLNEEVASMLNEAQIPFLTTNEAMINSDGTLLTTYIGVNDYDLGHMTGDWMANYILKGGLLNDEEVAVIILGRDDINMKSRSRGQFDRFTEMLTYFDENSIFQVTYNGEIQDSLEQTRAIMKSNGDYRTWLIMSCDDEGALGAVRALEELGLDTDAAVISVGGSLAESEFKREYSAFKAASYYSAEEIGSTAVTELIERIETDEDYIESLEFNAVIITKDNYQEMID